jgi:Ca2+/H+ antiporter
MEFIIAAILGILGAALIAGGIVGYRKSESARAKAFSAAAIAAGVVILAIITFIMPVNKVVGP